MKSCEEWKPFMIMIAIDISFAVVNILLKKVLDEGMNHLVFITYRLSIATIFVGSIGYFRERYVPFNPCFNSILLLLPFFFFLQIIDLVSMQIITSHYF